MKNIINKTLTIITLSILTVFNSHGQVDSKYLAGAVPEVDGKVVFSDTLSLAGMNKDSVYEYALMWSEANYNTDESRVVYLNKDRGVISCKGKTIITFSSSALSLDRTTMNYQLNIFCSDASCKIEMKSISYDYNVSHKSTPEKYYAEKWITDKEAVNKGKLYRLNGKFRVKTIDTFDDICNSLNLNIITGEVDLFTDKEKTKLYARKSNKDELKEITKGSVNKIIPPDPMTEDVRNVTDKIQRTPDTTPVIAAGASSNVAASTASLQGFKQLDPKKIPGNIIKMLTEDWMLVTAGNDSKFDMMTSSWGGLGALWGKPVVFCFINPSGYTFQLMENSDTYSISFYTETYRDALKYCETASGKDVDKVKGSGLTPIALPSGSKAFGEAWMIIECKKILSQQIQPGDVKDPKIKEEWGKSQFHKMYAGEILNVWVK